MPDVQPLEGKRRVRSKPKNVQSNTAAVSRDWTIKSLAPETVEVTREAAKRSGMKINAWVGQALEAAASVPVSTRTRTHVSDSEMVQLEHSILKEISDLKAQNANLVQTVNSISSMLLKMYDKID
jgi:hypothetical protein